MIERKRGNARIVSKKLFADRKFPGSSELQKYYNVSPITILWIYKDLVKLNVIEKAGRGYRIIDNNGVFLIDILVVFACAFNSARTFFVFH